jgi:hypothetical protein
MLNINNRGAIKAIIFDYHKFSVEAFSYHDPSLSLFLKKGMLNGICYNNYGYRSSYQAGGAILLIL